jgi:hypothetical protein
MSDLSLRILANLSLYSIIIPIVFGLVTWKQQDFSMKILVLGFGLYFLFFYALSSLPYNSPRAFLATSARFQTVYFSRFFIIVLSKMLF